MGKVIITYLLVSLSLISFSLKANTYYPEDQDTLQSSLVNMDSLLTYRLIHNIINLYQADPSRAIERAYYFADSLKRTKAPNEYKTNFRLSYLFNGIDIYEEATKYMLLDFEYHANIKDSVRMAAIAYRIALGHYFRGQITQAFKYFQDTYIIAIKSNNRDMELSSVLSLSQMYSSINKPEKALEFLNKAQELTKLLGTESTMPFILRDLGDQELAKGNYKAALDYHLQAEEYARSLDNQYLLPHIIGAIGHDYLNLKEYDKSLKYLRKAIEMELARQDYFGASRTFALIGNIYHQSENYDSAMYYYRKQLSYSLLMESKLDRSYAFNNLAYCYSSMQAYDSALIYIKKGKSYKDSLDKIDARTELSELITKFEKDFQVRQISHISKENELNQLKIEKNLFNLIAFIALLVLISFMALVLFRRNKIQAQKKIIEISQQSLRFQMNPHFIFNTLNSIQYYLFRNDKAASNTYLTKFAKLMELILDNSNNQSISIHEEIKTLELYLELEKLRFKEKLNYSIIIDDHIDQFEYRIPTLLIQPFVENSILHGIMPNEKNGIVKIELCLQNDKILCSIEDNGIGRDKAFQIKEKNKKTNISLGTKITQNRLSLISSFYKKDLQLSYFDLKDEQGNAIGTKVEITFPLITKS